jgi:hypothetical protein
MALLGEFGREAAPDGDPDLFSFHGDLFEIPGKVSALPVARFAWRTRELEHARAVADRNLARAHGGDAQDTAQAALATVEAGELAAVYEFLQGVIGVDQWTGFEQVAQRVGADFEELIGVCNQIAQAVTARPTRRPSGSTDGPSTSGDGSTGVSASLEPTPGSTNWGPGPMVIVPAVSETPAAARREIRAVLTPVGEGIRSGG